MFSEKIEIILYFFTVYSFFGWMLENTFNYLANGVFLKVNFFFGPFKPMYGIAPLLVITLFPEKNSLWLLLLACLLIPTFVEFVSGILLEKITRKKWWDYSKYHFQLHGHICLIFSVCWFILSLFCVKVIHPAISQLFDKVYPIWRMIWPFIFIYFLVEMIGAFRRHAYFQH